MIEVKNITKKYGNFTALDNVSFKIEKGEIVGLLGPNGAGKSTTMNIITGYIEPTQGEVMVNNINMLKKPKKAKREIGYMPEGVPLYYELTVREFVIYMAQLKRVSRKELKQKVNQVIKETFLEEVQNKLIKNLSRGYKQRVSMAGALVGDPQILILDEPTVGLDPKQVTEIRSLIKKLGETHTVIISSHILSEISQVCNKVIIINKGKLITVDTPDNLENKVSNNNAIYVIVEDPNNKMQTIQEKIQGIKNIDLVTEFEDGTKKYMIEQEKDVDLRKTLFSELAKENITIFEMKKADSTLEDAFMKLIEGGDN